MAGWNHNWNKFPPRKVEVRGKENPKIARAKEIRTLLMEGMTSEEIADALGMTAINVRSYIRLYNLRAPDVFVDKKK